MSSIRGTYALTAFGLLAAALAAAGAHAGYRIEMAGIEILVADGRLRRSISQVGIIMAFDPARDALWLANSKTRTYWQGTVAEYCSEAKQAQDAMKARMMGNLSPQQRQLMEQHTKQEQETAAAAPESPKRVRVTLERTGETEIIAGRSARK